MADLAPVDTDLLRQWRIAYATFVADESSADWDFQCLCIGWCVAKGLTTEEAYNFYQKMIPLELF